VKRQKFVLAAAVMLTTLLSGKAAISQGAAPKFDVQEKTIAQIQQAITSKQNTTRGFVEA
jgi:hypothetical protein